ncbi:MAG: hypothetical protein LUG96_09665 [Tannerellaceae bacterium]|nr:hypothetical protein [Tannerellaceae bacterium]
MQLQVTDSIHERLSRILSGYLIIWSQPDTTSQQYRLADLDFNIDTKKENDQTTQTTRQDTTTIHANQNHEGILKLSYTDEKQSDTRPWNGKLLTILIAILFTGFLISLYKKQK